VPSPSEEDLDPGRKVHRRVRRRKPDVTDIPRAVSGRDIQDEKILGTLHVATGRSDHLGGHLTPDKFANSKNATHDDILFAPHKTPEIQVPQVRIRRNGTTEILIENFQPAPYMAKLLS